MSYGGHRSSSRDLDGYGDGSLNFGGGYRGGSQDNGGYGGGRVQDYGSRDRDYRSAEGRQYTSDRDRSHDRDRRRGSSDRDRPSAHGTGRPTSDLDNKYAAYSTNRSRGRNDDERRGERRSFGDRGDRGDRGGDGGRRGGGRREDDGQEHLLLCYMHPPRPDRDPEPNIFIDAKFNYWNLPAKARVLLVSNVPKELNQTDFLFYLFSLYGDVERVKITRKKPSCALVEFSTATFAAVARDHLDNTPLLGENIAVTFSRFERVSLPTEFGFELDDLTKDFSGVQYQPCKRFATEELKKLNMKKIISPSSTLHVGNIPAGKSPNDIRMMFANYGFAVADCIGIAVRMTKKAHEAVNAAPRMFCYLDMASLDDAVLSLAQLSSPGGIRISFSRESVENVRLSCQQKGFEVLTGDQLPQ